MGVIPYREPEHDHDETPIGVVLDVGSSGLEMTDNRVMRKSLDEFKNYDYDNYIVLRYGEHEL